MFMLATHQSGRQPYSAANWSNSPAQMFMLCASIMLDMLIAARAGCHTCPDQDYSMARGVKLDWQWSGLSS
jgi:hypothetical protein